MAAADLRNDSDSDSESDGPTGYAPYTEDGHLVMQGPSGNVFIEPEAAPLIIGSDLDTTAEHTRKSRGTLVWRDVRDWWFDEGPVVICYLVWLAGSLAIGIYNTWKYWNTPNYYVTAARFFGGILKLNSAVILLPVLRNVLTWLRKIPFLHWLLPFDRAIAWHRHIGWLILLCGIGHVFSHFLNYNSTGIPWQFGWTTLAGTTGFFISFLMFFMYSSAWRDVRRRWFNQFWFTHHLFIIYFALMLAHAPTFWYYFIVPGVIYTAERLIREIRGRKTATSVSAIRLHPSDVIEVRMKKKRFSYKPGQYLFLACPAISRFEWHPFTITSAPEEDFVSVHIRCVGDWTKGFAKHLSPANAERHKSIELNQAVDAKGRAMVKLDGPFGAASEDVFRFRVVILVGGGIGVTPFASILKSIRFRLESRKGLGKLEKVYFFWTSRDQSAFEWFRELLAQVEQQLEELHLSDIVVINIYLTGQLKIEEIKRITETDLGADDPITRLRSKTSFGRPRFDQIFSRIRDAHRHTKIGVFFCGPKPLAASLEGYCKEFTKDYDIYKTRFVWRKEVF